MLAKATLFFFSLVVGLVLAEVMLRATSSAPPVVRFGETFGIQGPVVLVGGEEHEERSLQLSHLGVFTPHGVRLRPNISLTVENYPTSGRDISIRTNSFGFRSPEIASKTKERRRILFLGDSILFGEGVEEYETFVRQFEELFVGKVEAINAGIFGLGTKDEVRLLQEFVSSGKPDIVVLAFYLNDAIPSPVVHPIKIPPWLSWSYLAQKTSLAIGMLQSTNGLNPEQEAQLASIIAEPLAEDVSPSDKQLIDKASVDWGLAWKKGSWDLWRSSIREFVELTKSHSATPVVLMLPVRSQVTGELRSIWPQEQMKALTEELGVAFFDSLPVLKLAKDTPLFYDHCHFTPQGHAVVAHALQEWSQQNSFMKAD